MKLVVHWWSASHMLVNCARSESFTLPVPNIRVILLILFSEQNFQVAQCVNEDVMCRLRLKCDGTRAATTFRLLAKRTSPFKLMGASVQSTTGSPGVRISSSNAGYTMFRGIVKGTGYPLHSRFPLFPLPCVTVYHHVSTGLYQQIPPKPRRK